MFIASGHILCSCHRLNSEGIYTERILLNYNQMSVPINYQSSPDSKGTGGIVDRWHLRGCRERTTETQVPHRVVVHSWQIFGDGDSDRAVLLGESVLELDLLVIVDGVEIAHRVVVQPDTVVAAGILGQRIGTVAGGCSVETQVNGGTGGDG